MEEKKKMTVNEYCDFLLTIEKSELTKQLDDIDEDISWGHFQKRYLPGHEVGWIYDQLIGYVKRTDIPIEPMTPAEMVALKAGLLDLSERIRKTAETL